MTSTAVIDAAAIASASVAGDLVGQITVNGPLGPLSVEGNLSGEVSATSIASLMIGMDLSGQVTVSQSMGTLSVGGTISGSISAVVNGTAGDDAFIIMPGMVTLNGTLVFSGDATNLSVNSGEATTPSRFRDRRP